MVKGTSDSPNHHVLVQFTPFDQHREDRTEFELNIYSCLPFSFEFNVLPNLAYNRVHSMHHCKHLKYRFEASRETLPQLFAPWSTRLDVQKIFQIEQDELRPSERSGFE